MTRLLALLLLVLITGPAPAQGRFDGWATAVIAADWRDGGGRLISIRHCC